MVDLIESEATGTVDVTKTPATLTWGVRTINGLSIIEPGMQWTDPNTLRLFAELKSGGTWRSGVNVKVTISMENGGNRTTNRLTTMGYMREGIAEFNINFMEFTEFPQGTFQVSMVVDDPVYESNTLTDNGSWASTRDTYLTLVAAAAVLVGEPLAVSGMLFTSEGPVPAAPVKLYLNNQLLTTIITDSNGIWAANITGLIAGTHALLAVYEGGSI